MSNQPTPEQIAKLPAWARLRVDAHDHGNAGSGIKLQWEGGRRCSGKEAAFIPSSYQAARITSKDEMR